MKRSMEEECWCGHREELIRTDVVDSSTKGEEEVKRHVSMEETS